MTKSRSELLKGYVAIIYAMFLLFELINNFSGRSIDKWAFFYAFTQQSNIIVLIWLLIYGITRFVDFSKVKAIVENKNVIISITVYISITYFIVALLLNPIYTGASNPLSSTSELLLHQLTPVVMWIYYFIVRGKTTATIKKTLFGLIYPVIYLIANLFIGANFRYQDGSQAYAYGFTNPNNYANIISFILFIAMLVGLFSFFTIILTKLKNKIDETK